MKLGKEIGVYDKNGNVHLMRLHYKVESIKTNHHIVTKRTPFIVQQSRAVDHDHARYSHDRVYTSQQPRHQHNQHHALGNKSVPSPFKQFVSKIPNEHNNKPQDQADKNLTAAKIIGGRSKTAAHKDQVDKITTAIKIVGGRSKTAVKSGGGSGRSSTAFVSNSNGRSRTSTLSSNERNISNRKKNLPEPLTTTKSHILNPKPNELLGNSTHNNDNGGKNHGNNSPVCDDVGQTTGIKDLAYAVTDIQLSGVWKRVYDQKIERQNILNCNAHQQREKNAEVQPFDNTLRNKDDNFRMLPSNNPMDRAHLQSNKYGSESKVHSRNFFENEALLHSNNDTFETKSHIEDTRVSTNPGNVMELTETSLNCLDHTNENYLTSNIEDWINKVEEYNYIHGGCV